MGSPAHAGIDRGGLGVEQEMTGSPAHAGIDRDWAEQEMTGSPAHAGIDRDTGRNRRQANGFPRPRGDRPRRLGRRSKK